MNKIKQFVDAKVHNLFNSILLSIIIFNIKQPSL